MGIGMSVVGQLIEDVVTVALYVKDASAAFLERQIEDCTVAAIIRRTTYKHATVKVNVYLNTGTVTVKVELFDEFKGKPVALVEYSNALHRQIKSRKL